jgi:ubiquinone/menaquinone biosynthesis C-methylase UbiE
MLDKRGLHNVKLVEADLLHLPYSDKTFDLAVCLSVIEHIPEPLAALREMERVLCDDGVFILGYPLEHALLLLLERVIRVESRLRCLLRHQPLPRGKPFHPHVSDCRGLEKTVKKVFEIESRRTIRIIGCPVYRILQLRKATVLAVFHLALFFLG